jgi:hypothetical protein
MDIMKTIILGLTLSLTAGCSAVREKVIELAANDLQRTSEIAAKYGKPDVVKCTDFLLASIKSEDASQASITALLAEETNGIASAALKAAILADMVDSLRTGTAKAKFEADFQANCNAVSGAIMMNVLRAAKTAGSKGISN